MSYQRRLVEYVLQQQDAPVTARELAEVVVGVAIEAGSSMEIVEAINTRSVLGDLRALAHHARVEVAGFAMDVQRGRRVPRWAIRPGVLVPSDEPKPPPGIPAVMRSADTERAMDALLRAFANDAAATLVRVQGEIKQLTDRYSTQYNKLKEGQH